VLLALIAVHVVAALWHHFIRRDRVVARMVTDEAG
jgi:cytochrome b561